MSDTNKLAQAAPSEERMGNAFFAWIEDKKPLKIHRLSFEAGYRAALDSERGKREGIRSLRLDLVSTYPNLPGDDPLRRAYESGVHDALAYARPAPDAAALRELIDWAQGTNHDSAECRMPRQSEVYARIGALLRSEPRKE